MQVAILLSAAFVAPDSSQEVYLGVTAVMACAFAHRFESVDELVFSFRIYYISRCIFICQDIFRTSVRIPLAAFV